MIGKYDTELDHRQHIFGLSRKCAESCQRDGVELIRGRCPIRFLDSGIIFGEWAFRPQGHVVGLNVQPTCRVSLLHAWRGFSINMKLPNITVQPMRRLFLLRMAIVL